VYADRWSQRLRQGDVIDRLLLPTIGKSYDVISKGSGFSGTADSPVKKLVIDGEEHFWVVVSHCCEFNEDKRNKFLVARMQTIRGDYTPEQIAEVRESNDIKVPTADGRDIQAVNSFLFEPITGYFGKEKVAMFDSITAVPMAMHAVFVEKKIAELEHPTRLLFREKAAWFFGRQAEDIPDEEKVPAPPQPPEDR
jgi:hypothetical protein